MNLNLNLESLLRVSILDSISDLFTLRKLGELFTLSSGSPSRADLVIQKSFLCVVLQVPFYSTSPRISNM